MDIFTRSLGKSLSRLELTIAAMVIFIVLALFLRQVLLMSARAERHFLEASVININSALHYQAGLLQLSGRFRELDAMVGMNPFRMAETAPDVALDLEVEEEGQNRKMELYNEAQYRVLPARYRGEVDRLDVEEMPPGSWYFDRSRKELVYRVSNDEFFELEDAEDDVAVIRYRVEFLYQDKNGNGSFERGVDLYRGIGIVDLGGYQWQI